MRSTDQHHKHPYLVGDPNAMLLPPPSRGSSFGPHSTCYLVFKQYEKPTNQQILNAFEEYLDGKTDVALLSSLGPQTHLAEGGTAFLVAPTHPKFTKDMTPAKREALRAIERKDVRQALGFKNNNGHDVTWKSSGRSFRVHLHYHTLRNSLPCTTNKPDCECVNYRTNDCMVEQPLNRVLIELLYEIFAGDSQKNRKMLCILYTSLVAISSGGQ
eukprot:gb/GEZN01003595.1/.p2 GENE.gb/GEZN01003595.1/~~gb/GEZN01003595.1/.p2  ORF type:complete len:214 (-),score=20.24 gb/GEZN01003595.1/:1328-1969(-)